MKNNKNPFARITVEMTFTTGMFMLGYGLWLIKPEAMFTVMGIIFISMAVLLHRGFKKTNGGG